MKPFACLLLLLLGASCNFSAEQNTTAPSAAKTTSGLPSGWSTHRDSAGFTIAIPAGWNVRTEKQTGRILVQGTQGEQSAIWPTFLPQQQLDANSAGMLARQIAPRLDPQAAWGPPENTSNFVRLTARGAQRKGVLLLTWTNKPIGAQVCVYASSAPASSYRTSADMFARVFESFRIESATEKQAPINSGFAASPKYVQWMDPNESAFTLAVPEGWKALGGAYRFTATDIRKGVNLFSPDGQVRILYGDANIPAFTLPTPMYSQLGMREGTYTTLGDGSKLLIRGYLSGEQFARDYVENTMRGQCQNLRILSTGNRPELTKLAAPSQMVPGIARVETTAGEVAFSCTVNGRSLEGYVAAVTRVAYSSMQGGLWYVENLFGVLAPTQSIQPAKAVCEKVASSFRLDPGWENRQRQISAAAVQQDYARSQQIQQRALRAIQEDLRATSDIIVNGYNQRQATYDEISRKRENAILGTVDVVDPASGRQYKIENYSDYHWMDNQGNIAGTRTADSPGLGWRQMLDLP